MLTAGEQGVVDAHVAVGELAHLAPVDVGEVLARMDENGVQRAVLGPVGRWVAVDNAEGNDTLRRWCSMHPDRLRHYAVANPWYGKRATDELRRALDAGAVGYKLEPARQGVALLDPLLDPLLDVADEYGRPVYVVTGVPVASEPLQLAELALRRPRVTFVMGRSGRTDFSLDLVPALTSSDNLVAETAYNGASLIADLVARIGPGRVVFASDAPLNDLELELERTRLADLDEPDRAAVMAGTASTLFGWSPATEDLSR